MNATSWQLETSTVRGALLKRADSRHLMALGQLALGILLTFFIPLFFAACGVLFAGASGLMLFTVIVLLPMPIAYFLEWRTQGGYLLNRLMEIKRSDGGWYEAITRDRTWRWDARAGAAQWEILLVAPRAVFAGAAKLHAERMVAVADSTRAAEILAALAAQEHGVMADELRRTGENPLAFGQAMSYLAFYEWIGISENGQKVWALTESREELGLAVDLDH